MNVAESFDARVTGIGSTFTLTPAPMTFVKEPTGYPAHTRFHSARSEVLCVEDNQARRPGPAASLFLPGRDGSLPPENGLIAADQASRRRPTLGSSRAGGCGIASCRGPGAGRAAR